MTTHILIADDHDLYRNGLKAHILQVFDQDGAVVYEASDYEQTSALIAAQNNLDICLLDLNMPGPLSLSGLILQHPGVPIIVISGSNDMSDMQACFDMGVMGYVPKNEPAAVIIKAIELVLAGGLYVPSAFVSNGQAQQHQKTERSLLDELTQRQREVLNLIAKGYSNKEVAREMSLAESTVKSHLAIILKTLNVKNRTQAVVLMNNS